VAPTPTAPVATPTPAGRPTPAPEARPSASGGATIADARAQLARGALAEAAGTFSKALRPAAASRFTVQVLTACSPETVQKAIAATASAQELFVLPVNVQGRSCYRICWGLYDTRPAAETAAPPAYFRQAGVRPRVSGVAELLP
jgi:septal ring-binding cell division protein DamX